MAFTGVAIDPGPNPGFNVANEQVAGIDYQAIKLVDSTPGSNAPIGVTANPMVVSDPALLTFIQGGIVVTAAPLPANAATSGHQTDGTQKTQIVGAGGNIGVVSAGGNLGVSIGAALPAGTNAIGNVKIIDGPGGTLQASVKASSTAAATTDTSLVVAVSPNTPLPAGSNSIGSVLAGVTNFPTGFQLIDTAGTIRAKIAAGSVLPAATDPALIVTVRDTVNTFINGGSIGNAFVLDATATGGAQKSQIVSATNVNWAISAGGVGSVSAVVPAGVQILDAGGSVKGTIKAASTAPISTDTSLVVSINPNGAGVSVGGATAEAQSFTPGSGTVFRGAYLVDEVAGSTVAEDAMGISRMDAKRAQVLTIEDAATRGQRVAVSAAGALKVDASANAITLSASGATVGTVVISAPSIQGSATTNFTAIADTLVFATNSAVRERIVQNDSDQDVLLGLGAAVTTSLYTVRIKAGGGFYSTSFFGSFHAMMVAAPASGNCLITQLT